MTPQWSPLAGLLVFDTYGTTLQSLSPPVNGSALKVSLTSPVDSHGGIFMHRQGRDLRRDGLYDASRHGGPTALVAKSVCRDVRLDERITLQCLRATHLCRWPLDGDAISPVTPKLPDCEWQPQSDAAYRKTAPNKYPCG